jgi:hypothetical protein
LDPFPSIVPDDDEKYPVPGMRGYSPDKFYTRGSDRRGHCKEYRVTLSQDWPPLLAAIVETIPEYDSMAGLIRDAVFHRAQYLLEHLDDPMLLANLRNAQIMQDQRAIHEQSQRWLKYLDDCADWIDEMCKDKNRAGLADLATSLEEFAMTLPDNYAGQAVNLAESARRKILRAAAPPFE